MEATEGLRKVALEMKNAWIYLNKSALPLLSKCITWANFLKV